MYFLNQILNPEKKNNCLVAHLLYLIKTNPKPNKTTNEKK